jgi:hypothetical protein
MGPLKSDKDLWWEVRQHGKQNFLWIKGRHNKTKLETNSMSFCRENKFTVPRFCSIHEPKRASSICHRARTVNLAVTHCILHIFPETEAPVWGHGLSKVGVTNSSSLLLMSEHGNKILNVR